MTWQLWICAAVGGLGSAGLCTLLLLGAYSTRLAQRLGTQPSAMPEGAEWPSVSIIVPACDEAATIEAAAQTLLATDYPALELILINDRSTDTTGALIDRLAEQDPRVLAVHISELPTGWLGKVHAMHVGTARASGELLLYTDADVHFEPTALRRAVAWMEREQLGHLALIPRLDGRGLAYNATISCFAVLFLAAIKAWRIGKPGSRSYGGVGAFSMVRRSDFETTQGWEWLKMEVGDDVGLGMMMVREAGAASVLGIAADSLRVDWYPSVSALVGGLEKNAFGAMCGYSAWRTFGVFVAMACLTGGPFLAAASPVPWLWSVSVATAVALVLLAAALRSVGQPFFASLLCPIGLPILAITMARSCITTLRQGGIRWRGQFYPLAELKAGRRVDL